jgi:IS30 family transposase
MSDRDAKGAIRAARDRKIRELARRGFSIDEIALKLGVSRPTVSRALGRSRPTR